MKKYIAFGLLLASFNLAYTEPKNLKEILADNDFPATKQAKKKCNVTDNKVVCKNFHLSDILPQDEREDAKHGLDKYVKFKNLSIFLDKQTSKLDFNIIFKDIDKELDSLKNKSFIDLAPKTSNCALEDKAKGMKGFGKANCQIDSKALAITIKTSTEILSDKNIDFIQHYSEDFNRYSNKTPTEMLLDNFKKITSGKAEIVIKSKKDISRVLIPIIAEINSGNKELPAITLKTPKSEYEAYIQKYIDLAKASLPLISQAHVSPDDTQAITKMQTNLDALGIFLKGKKSTLHINIPNEHIVIASKKNSLEKIGIYLLINMDVTAK